MAQEDVNDRLYVREETSQGFQGSRPPADIEAYKEMDARSSAQSLREAATPLPLRWDVYYDKTHNAYYFHNDEVGSTWYHEQIIEVFQGDCKLKIPNQQPTFATGLASQPEVEIKDLDTDGDRQPTITELASAVALENEPQADAKAAKLAASVSSLVAKLQKHEQEAAKFVQEAHNLRVSAQSVLASLASEEADIPAHVGTDVATDVLWPGDEVIVSCAVGDTGHIYKGLLDSEGIEQDLDTDGDRQPTITELASAVALENEPQAGKADA